MYKIIENDFHNTICALSVTYVRTRSTLYKHSRPKHIYDQAAIHQTCVWNTTHIILSGTIIHMNARADRQGSSTVVGRRHAVAVCTLFASLFLLTFLFSASAPALAQQPDSEYVPAWVRNLALLFDNGNITAAEFDVALAYLMDKGIMDFGSTDSLEADNPEKMTRGTMVRVIDGNTVHIDNTRIRLSLVDVENSGDTEAPHAVLARILCPAGLPAYHDVDDMQPVDVYGRTVAVVYCSGASLNQLMVEFGLGWINEYYCPRSEFHDEVWAWPCADVVLGSMGLPWVAYAAPYFGDVPDTGETGKNTLEEALKIQHSRVGDTYMDRDHDPNAPFFFDSWYVFTAFTATVITFGATAAVFFFRARSGKYTAMGKD